jgi:CheY-like chemotaxis protein
VASRPAAEPLVIVVDDDRLLLRAWRRVLGRLPIRLRCVESAEAALQAIAAERPAVVISDQHMPGVTGLELLARIRHDDPAVELVLFTTDASALVRAVGEGFRALDKSSAPEELRGFVEALVAGRLPPRPSS